MVPNVDVLVGTATKREEGIHVFLPRIRKILAIMFVCLGTKLVPTRTQEAVILQHCRVEKIHPAYTSQRCSACGRVDAKSRRSQALFACTVCGYACHADVNAARNIAAGHAVTARGPPGRRSG
jgi:hypothetical protein